MKHKHKEKEESKEEAKEEIMKDDEQFYKDIDQLQAQGINAADISKLKQAGLHTIMSIGMCPKKEMLNIKGITDAKAEKIYEAATKLECGGFCTALEVVTKRKKVKKITTGSKILNSLLGGGIETMAITEAFGEFRTGKTQLAHTLAVTSQLPVSDGGGAGKVLYIDTEGTFRPDRITKIAEKFELDGEAVLGNIMYSRAYTVDQLNSNLIAAASLMLEGAFTLLIVDSIMAPFRVDFTGRGELAERQQFLGKVLSRLMKLAEQFNIAVYLTNQVTADPAGGMSYVADPKKPVGGNILAHASTTRLYMKKGKGEQRICRIYDSPSLPESECLFQISDVGIIDVQE
jgi:meiotic recombination protein DMC1